MKAQTKPKVKAKSNATNSRVVTAGEIFADGVMLELVSGSSESNQPNLLLWNGTKATIGSTIAHRGLTYEALELAPSIYRATRLPNRNADFVSARKLYTAIADLFKQYLDLPDRESSLLACFSISTWLTDHLPSAPTLAISGPSQELGMDALSLLSCVCRHPLMLAEVTPGGFRSLPMELGLTLLLIQQGLKASLQGIFRASSYPGLRLPGNRGNVVNLYGPKAIFCGNDVAAEGLGSGVIHVAIAPSQLQPSILDKKAQDEIAEDFQPRLLMYRLKNSAKVRGTQVDVSQFGIATRRLAGTLGMCFPEDSKLAREMVELLRPQDEAIRAQQSLDINCVMVEILLGLIHERKQREVQVAELAKDVNALLRSRGEVLKYRAEEIGWRLHTLCVPRHTTGSGRQVLLGRETSRIVHRLAQAYCPSSRARVVSCTDCKTSQSD